MQAKRTFSHAPPPRPGPDPARRPPGRCRVAGPAPRCRLPARRGLHPRPALADRGRAGRRPRRGGGAEARLAARPPDRQGTARDGRDPGPPRPRPHRGARRKDDQGGRRAAARRRQAAVPPVPRLVAGPEPERPRPAAPGPAIPPPRLPRRGRPRGDGGPAGGCKRRSGRCFRAKGWPKGKRLWAARRHASLGDGVWPCATNKKATRRPGTCGGGSGTDGARPYWSDDPSPHAKDLDP